MNKLSVSCLTVGMVGTNCYLAVNEETKEALIIDPGEEADRITAKLSELNAKPVAILLTHGHFDHVMAAEELAESYGIRRYILDQEMRVLKDPVLNVSGMIGQRDSYQADVELKDGETISLAGFSIRVIHTPGHTPGGCCFYFEEEGVLFSGDTLFEESVGRTDFPEGSMGELVRSIKEKLFVLPNETKVYPGHMGTTTIQREKTNNPFV